MPTQNELTPKEVERLGRKLLKLLNELHEELADVLGG